MATSKTLSIILKTVDQATSPIKRIVTSIGSLGTKMIRIDKMLINSAKRIARAAFSVKGAITGLAAIMAARVVWGSIKETLTRLDEITKRSRDFGIAVEQMSVIDFAASLAGVEVRSLATAFRTASKNLTEFARTGTGEAAQTLQDLNIQVTDGTGHVRDLVELIPEIGAAIEGLPQTERLGILSELFGGRGAIAIERLVKSGDLTKFRAELEALGGVVTAQQGAAAEAVNDALTRVDTAWEGLKARVVADIGPTLADLLNQIAVFVAMVPTLVGRAAKFVQDLFGDGPARDAAREKLAAFLQSLSDLIVSTLQNFGRILLATLLVVTNALFIALGPEVKAATVRFLISVIADSMTAANQFLGDQLRKMAASTTNVIGKAALNALAGAFEMQAIFGDLGKHGLIQMTDEFFLAADTIETFNAHVQDAGRYTTMLSDAVAKLKEDAGAGGAEAFADLDAILGFLDEYNRRAQALAASMNQVRTGGRGAGGGGNTDGEEVIPGNFFQGVKVAINELEAKAKHLHNFGKQLASSLADHVSSELTTAIINVATGVNSLKEAFRDFASSTLRLVSQLILRMLILRAISGVASAAAGSGGQSTGAEFMGPLNNSGGIIGRGVAGRIRPTGALARAAGIAMLAGGGLVMNGAQANRDSVLAGLTRGEGVVNRAGMRANGAATLAYMNTGGRVAPAGGGAGAGVVVQQTVVIQGGQPDARTLKQLRQASRDGVLDGLRRDPGFRESVRRSLA